MTLQIIVEGQTGGDWVRENLAAPAFPSPL